MGPGPHYSAGAVFVARDSALGSRCVVPQPRGADAPLTDFPHPSQIIAIQSLFYLSLGVLLYLTIGALALLPAIRGDRSRENRDAAREGGRAQTRAAARLAAREPKMALKSAASASALIRTIQAAAPERPPPSCSEATPAYRSRSPRDGLSPL